MDALGLHHQSQYSGEREKENDDEREANRYVLRGKKKATLVECLSWRVGDVDTGHPRKFSSVHITKNLPNPQLSMREMKLKLNAQTDIRPNLSTP